MTTDAFDDRFAVIRKHISPLGKIIGLVVERGAPGQAWSRIAYDPVFVGDMASGVLHSGVVTTLLDETCGFAVQLALETPMAIATLDLRIDYLKPAAPGRNLHAHAHCYRMTSSIAFVRAFAFQDSEDDPVACATATFMVGAYRADMWGAESKVDFRALPKLEAPAAAVDYLGTSPYSRFLGVQSGADGVAILPYQPKLVGNPMLPALHGGAIGSFLETAAIIGVGREIDAALAPKPINVTFNYLRSGRPRDTFAKATIVKQGRRVVAFEAQAWQADRSAPIASAYGHFKLRRDPAAGEAP